MKFLNILLAVLVPPVGILLTYGLSTTLVINILLTLLGYLPGMLHGLWAVLKYYQKLNQEAAS